MAVRDTAWPVGAPCWVDLTADDLEATRSFYADLLGWEFVDTGADYGHYSIAMVDRRPVAGVGRANAAFCDNAKAWTTYLAVGDVEATATAITEAGGELIVPPGDVGDAARIAVAVDAAGAVFGVYEGGRMAGTQVVGVPGAPAWYDCMTREYAAAKRFYGLVFGCGFDEPSHGDFEYATIRVGDDSTEVGGIGALPGTLDVPPHWTTYFAVTDVDHTVSQLVDLGGTVHGGPVDSPRGRLAAVADPGGAYFRVIES